LPAAGQLAVARSKVVVVAGCFLPPAWLHSADFAAVAGMRTSGPSLAAEWRGEMEEWVFCWQQREELVLAAAGKTTEKKEWRRQVWGRKLRGNPMGFLSLENLLVALGVLRNRLLMHFGGEE
jgi:hypothetical protein